MIKETKVYLGQLDQKGKEVLLDHLVQQDQRVQLDHGDLWVLRVQEVLEVDLVFQEQKVIRGQQDFLVGMDNQGRLDHKGHRGPEE